jgi:hypothetical protein
MPSVLIADDAAFIVTPFPSELVVDAIPKALA